MKSRSKMNENRKEEILANLQRERGIRRRQIEENYCYNYNSKNREEYDQEPFDNINADEFKDPREILMSGPGDYDNDYSPQEYAEERQPSNLSSSTVQRNSEIPRSNVFNANIVKECLDYSTKSDYEKVPRGYSNRRKSTEEGLIEPLPQKIAVNPEKPPVKEQSFEFDQSSRIAQEIKRKYYVKPVSNPVYQRITAATEAHLAKHTAVPLRSKSRRLPGRGRPATTKENYPPTYMKPTAIAGIRNSHSPNELPDKVRKIAQEKEQKIREECTFKPHINSTEYDDKLEQNKYERRSRLYKPKVEEIQKREKLKRQREDEEFSNICTFQPKKISQTTSCIDLKMRTDFNQSIEDRLYVDANKRIEELRNAYKSKEQRELKECTFQPDISRSSKNVRGNRITEKPIYERAKDLQRQKEENLQKMRIEAELKDENLTFKPKIIKKSEEILMNRSDLLGQSVIDRLCKDAADRVEKSLKQTEFMSQQQSVQYPFNPRLSNSTCSFTSIGEGTLLTKGFKERQEYFEKKRREKREEILKQTKDNKYTFKPEINFTSEILMEADPKRMIETDDERIQRLSRKDPKYEEKLKKIKDIEIKSKYTYHPQINQTSRMMVMNKSIDSISIAEREKTNRERLIEEVTETKERECTFKPQINSSNAFSYYTKKEEILGIIKEREQERIQKMEQQKRDMEYEEMKDCTFQPAIVRPMTQSESVVIKGLGRHLELQEKRKIIEKERKERERQIFGFAERYDQHEIHDTIPQPFKLSEKRYRESRREIKECTFQHENNNSKEFKDNPDDQSVQMPEEYTIGIYN